jgi:hypothetical protein
MPKSASLRLGGRPRRAAVLRNATARGQRDSVVPTDSNKGIVGQKYFDRSECSD